MISCLRVSVWQRYQLYSASMMQGGFARPPVSLRGVHRFTFFASTAKSQALFRGPRGCFFMRFQEQNPVVSRHLILHIGHAKTGTTTLQRTLVASKEVLSEKGVLHPNTAPHKHNHRMLIPHLLQPSDQDMTHPDVETAQGLWHELVQEVDRKAPHTVVLSSEQLFRAWKPDQMAAMKDKLQTIASKITVIVYVREPAATVLSGYQQALKSRALPAGGLRVPNTRAALQAFMDADFDDLRVKTFDRSLLAGGSIVQDFFNSVLPDVDPAELVAPEDDNTSMSAEAMAVMQDIRSGKRRFWVGKPRREVRFADHALDGFSRPKLLSEVRDAIRVTYEHYDWLRNEHGVTFPGVDMPDMTKAKAHEILQNVSAVEDFCKVDAERKAKLWAKLNRPSSMLRRLFSPA